MDYKTLVLVVEVTQQNMNVVKEVGSFKKFTTKSVRINLYFKSLKLKKSLQ